MMISHDLRSKLFFCVFPFSLIVKNFILTKLNVNHFFQFVAQDGVHEDIFDGHDPFNLAPFINKRR